MYVRCMWCHVWPRCAGKSWRLEMIASKLCWKLKKVNCVSWSHG
jgi:hypothetical protein